MPDNTNAPASGDIYRTQPVDDLDEAGEGKALLAFYDRVPHRLELSEPPDSEGLYRTAIVAYTADKAAPFAIRLLSRYGEVSMCSFVYEQYEGFKEITVHGVNQDEETVIDFLVAIPAMAEYLSDLLMFHRIDPPSCKYVSNEYHSRGRR